jgi:hypothetical protein
VAAHAEEVRVDPSSDPGRDEYGLPPVDIQIPDDARDLDRDVQAYHRELRVQRRRMRVRRLTRPLSRHGMVIPLVAGCLALTLLSGTLLTLLAGRQVPPAQIRTSAAAPAAPSSPPPSSASGPLPDVPVKVDGTFVRLRSLVVPAVLAWVPAACGCAMALRQLAGQAAAAHVSFYLVGTGRAVAQLPALAVQVNQRPSHVVDDTTDALSIYDPIELTAILAGRSGTVGGVVRHLPDGDQKVVAGLQSLAGASGGPATRAPSPSGGVTPAS